MLLQLQVCSYDDTNDDKIDDDDYYEDDDDDDDVFIQSYKATKQQA